MIKFKKMRPRIIMLTKTIKFSTQEINMLDKMSYLQSRCDPNQEYYNDVHEVFQVFNKYEIKQMDYDSEMAWRHINYDPPTKKID